MNNSEALAKFLKTMGYTHCFYVAGGNIMHILDIVDREFISIPFVSEYSAAIAAEYFNESNDYNHKAFALVTAGPGLTNTVTAIAGAFLESRSLLVVGGQVKEQDLSDGRVRQIGIQEIDGVSLVSTITKDSQRLTSNIDWEQIKRSLFLAESGKPGPVFLEIPLNVQAQNADIESIEISIGDLNLGSNVLASDKQIADSLALFREAKRPVLLLGGGISRKCADKVRAKLRKLSTPIMTTWNGADRYASDEFNYFGRPNTWGQRYANVLIQQADLVIAVGTRLGLQQTGFNYREFVPRGRIIQIDIEPNEIKKDFLNIAAGYSVDANDYLEKFVDGIFVNSYEAFHQDWLNFCSYVRNALPLYENSNESHEGFYDPYSFMLEISELLRGEEVVLPSSSGGAMTVCMQTLRHKQGTKLITSKSLASMGYGLAAAIGASFSNPKAKIVHIEGDGGFAQNLQEMGTISSHNLNVKTFILDNEGYASIRMTQRNYFGGRYIGCDKSTGLGLPNWMKFFESYDIEVMELNPKIPLTQQSKFVSSWEKVGPAAFIVPVHPEQTYFPKISSRVLESGGMASAPLHEMTPDLPEEVRNRVIKYL